VSQLQSPQPGSGSAPPQRSALVGFFIAAVAAAFLFFVWVIYYYSWLHRPLNTAVVSVDGDATWDGAVVEVEGLGTDMQTATLNRENGYSVHMAMLRGTYTLRIRRGGQVLLTPKQFELQEREVRIATLPPLKEATTAPARGR
jgi:hypothetical protein